MSSAGRTGSARGPRFLRWTAPGRKRRTPFGIIHSFRTARGVTLLAVFSFLSACRHAPASASASASGVMTDGALAPSPRLVIGRVIAVEPAQGFVFVDLAADAPAAALTEGTELIVRTLDLRETARLRTSRYVRGRTLGTKILGGQPSPGDEVVWLAP